MHGASLLIRINPEGPSTCGITDSMIYASREDAKKTDSEEYIPHKLEEKDTKNIDVIRAILFGRMYVLKEINYSE